MNKLDAKIAVVTGASKGIGAAIAQQLGRMGATVVVNYARSKDDAERVVNSIVEEGGTATSLQADLSTAGGVEQLFDAVQSQFGKVDILVNNAGTYDFSPIDTLSTDAIRAMFDLNVTGLLLATKSAVALMPEGGSIINISSNAAGTAPAMTAIYAGTKGAVDTITRVLSQELGPRKIRVNAVAPGAVRTEGFIEIGNLQHEAEFVKLTPLGRLGEPNDIATVVAFLASPEAGWVTGSIIDAAGGWR